jgi:hypothetical protein
MKWVFTFVFIFLSQALAQTVNVKDVPVDSTSSTTIEIRKGERAQKTEVIWETSEGEAPVVGEHQALRKDARVDWKKACADWKKEFREENKENKILVLSCGSPSCVSEAEGTVCKSQGMYRIKTRLN